jgi:hypothetical protein
VQREDLELARDDTLRMRAAEREANAIEHPRLDADAEPTQREEVLAQLGYRLELLRQATGDARRVEAQAACGLIERALGRSPDDECLALLLAELSLTELSAAALARQLAQRFFAQSGNQARWATLLRHAAALVGAQALAARLIVDRLADRRLARALAGEIIARLREGAPYGEAERAVLESKALH